MKILLVVNILSGGGGERVVQTLANHLCSRDGCHVVVITLETSHNSYVLDERVRLRVLRSARLCRGIGKVLCIPVQAYELHRIVRKEKPDASIGFLVRSNLVLLLSRRFGNTYPIFASEHSPSQRQYGSHDMRSWIMGRLIRWLYPRADGVFAVSNGVKDSLLTFGVSPSKVRVVYNPLPLRKLEEMALQPPSLQMRVDVCRVVTMGRLIDLKDHETLIRAFAKVRATVNACLYIIGDGPNRQALERLTHALQVGDVVRFLGWQSNPFALLKQADVFVLSSRFEGFGNVLVEAMACGLPVVSSDCPGGPREILKGGECGVLVGVGDVDGFAHAITTLLCKPEVRAEYARKGKDRAREFDVPLIAEEYLAALRGV